MVIINSKWWQIKPNILIIMSLLFLFTLWDTLELEIKPTQSSTALL